MSPATTALGPVARAGVGGAPRPSVSFEFSPPKTPEAEESLWEAIRRLEPLNPSFVSVTYGAGGSTRDRTHRTVLRMLKETTLKPAAHLTCVEASRGDVDEVIQDYWDAGIRHIVALRGDPPGQIGGAYTPRADGYCNATELTAGIRAIAPFEVSVGLYPQIHPESPSIEHDIDVLKAKIDAGASDGAQGCLGGTHAALLRPSRPRSAIHILTVRPSARLEGRSLSCTRERPASASHRAISCSANPRRRC